MQFEGGIFLSCSFCLGSHPEYIHRPVVFTLKTKANNFARPVEEYARGCGVSIVNLI